MEIYHEQVKKLNPFSSIKEILDRLPQISPLISHSHIHHRFIYDSYSSLPTEVSKMNKTTVSLLLLIFAMMLTTSPSIAQDQPKILLGIDGEVGTQILNALQDNYDVIRVPANELIDKANRENVLGSLPEIIIGLSGDIPLLATKNIITPVANMSEEKTLPALERGASFFEITETSKFSASIINGTVALYGYPVGGIADLIYVNTELVDLSKADFSTAEGLSSAAIKFNDQTNPLNKIYGLGFENALDTPLALIYDFGGTLFKDNVVDLDHLALYDQNTVDAFSEINKLVNLRKVTPEWDMQKDGGAENLFKMDGKLSILLGKSTLLSNMTASGTIFANGSQGFDVFAMPGGSKVQAITVMSTKSNMDMSLAKTIAETLRASDFQNDLKSKGVIPYSASMLDTSIPTESAMLEAAKTFVDIPHDPKWQTVEQKFEVQMTKLLKGDQNDSVTLLGLEISLKLELPTSVPWSDLPELPKMEETSTSSEMTTSETQESSSSSEEKSPIGWWFVPTLVALPLAKRGGKKK